jgi:transposase
MMNQPTKAVATLGIDLAKRIFALHGVDTAGTVVLRRTLGRAQLLEFVAKLQPCVIGMEACSGAHEWARRLAQFGHTVRLIAPSFVTPYRKSGKNDANDAEAICEAVSRPNMRFVAIKSIEQQAILTLHRARQGYVEERTALINRIRGLMSEFGHVFTTRHAALRRGMAAAIESLPELARGAMTDLLDHLRILSERVG